LVKGGIDVVSVANNHSMNGGEKGLIEIIETLSKLGIVYVGGGEIYEEAHELKVIEAKGFKVGFLAYTEIGNQVAGKNKPGIAKFDKNIFSEIIEAKKKIEILIVSLHWGIEGAFEPIKD